MDKSKLILYQNEDLIIANKPAGVPSQQDQTEDASILSIMEDQFSQPLFLVNRLDRPVSGCILLATSSKAQAMYSNISIQKRYVAITSIRDIDPQGELIYYLKRDGRKRKAFISDKKAKGYKACHMNYLIKHQFDKYLAIDIDIETGRFHQIRAGLSHFQMPVKGDVKYGARRGNKDRSIDLHAYSISIDNNALVVYADPYRSNSIWQKVSELYTS